MRFVIVTGMSGAGKSSALKMLEDNGYFCVDNLPVGLLQRFSKMIWEEKNQLGNAAVGIDIRSRAHLKMLPRVLDSMKEAGFYYEILFLDCRNETLVRRFKETRRSHPLGRGRRIEEAIADERMQLEFLKLRSNYIIDTSNLLIRDLTQQMRKIFVENREFENFIVTVESFGFKYGIPTDADLVFDVRFLPNPFYIEELKKLTGNDKPVSDYVLSFPQTGEFRKKLTDMIRFLIPYYVEEGKNQLVIAIGCTGGQHRSVTIANCLYEDLKGGGDYALKIYHRDAL